MKPTVQYPHHNALVHVIEENKGKHREVCLCFQCAKFNMNDRARNCLIANVVYYNAQKYNIVTPVWECPVYTPVKVAKAEELAEVLADVVDDQDPADLIPDAADLEINGENTANDGGPV